MIDADWMIYGAYGFTGALLTKHAVENGESPIISGRSEGPLKELSQEYDLEYRVVSLDDERQLKNALSDVDLLLHAAGPFSKTSDPMIRACLAERTHYLDLAGAGEIRAFKNTLSYDSKAQDRGVCLISGMGFDVVPTDCLAHHVVEECSNPHHLELAVLTDPRPTPGTVATWLEMFADGAAIREEGRVRREPLGQRTVDVTFPSGEYTGLLAPLGDIVTAGHSTGIENIHTYVAFPRLPATLFNLAAPLVQRLLNVDSLRQSIQYVAEKLFSGPSETHREQSRSYVWARVTGEDEQVEQAWLEAPQTYRLTVEASLLGIRKILETNPKGALSPSMALGTDFVMEISDTRRYEDATEIPE